MAHFPLLMYMANTNSDSKYLFVYRLFDLVEFSFTTMISGVNKRSIRLSVFLRTFKEVHKIDF